MNRRFLAMLRKEFEQLLQDLPILFILLWAFTGAIYAAGHSISMDVQDYPVVVLDLSRTPTSRDLTSRLRSPHFKIVSYVSSDQELEDHLDRGEAALAVVIPPDFERKVREGQGTFQVVTDGTQTMIASVAASYVAEVAQDLNLRLLEAELNDQVARVPVDARLRVAFNPNITSSWFSSLLELLNMTTMVSVLLAAAAMVREKERGTLEQLLVSPLRPVELFAAKVLPIVIFVPLLSLAALFGIVHGIFDTPVRGSVLLFYAVTTAFVFCCASLGVALASLAKNMAQVAMLLLLVLFPMLFLSGATTPPESMSPWLRYASLLSPMRYYLDFGFQVLFKGNGLRYVWHDLLGLAVFGSGMFAFAMWRFRRTVG